MIQGPPFFVVTTRTPFTVRAGLPGEAAPLPEQEVEMVGKRCQGVEFVVTPYGALS